jgi:hypothetical protein
MVNACGKVFDRRGLEGIYRIESDGWMRTTVRETLILG